MRNYVYVIQSKKSGRYYIGITNSLDRRLEEHNRGHTKSTRGKGPWEIVYSEEYEEREIALRREKYLKSYRGREELKNKLLSNS